MSPLIQHLRVLIIGLVLAVPALSTAQLPKAGEPAAVIEAARKEMALVQTLLRGEADDTAMLDARRRALAAQVQAETAATALAAELAEVEARLAELGTPAEGVKEAPEIAAQRASLASAQSRLDAQVKLARLLSVEAGQVATSVLVERRSKASAELLDRAHAVTDPLFWKELATALPADLRRADKLLGELRDRIAAASSTLSWIAALFLAAVLLARKPLQKLVLHLILTHVPPGRLRRSLHAVGVMLVWTVTPGLAAHAVYLALVSGSGPSAELRSLLAGIDGIVWFAGFAAGLGQALLMPGKPSWRLPPIADETANRLRWFPPASAFALVLGWISTQLSFAVDASATTSTTLNGLTSLTLMLLMLAALVQMRRARRELRHAAQAELEAKADKTDKARHATPPVAAPLWLPTLQAIASVLLALALLALLSGYVELGIFVINQSIWVMVVSGAAWLLAMLIDDLFMTLLAPTALPPETGDKADKTAAGMPAKAQPRTREQIAVLLSGGCRLALLFLAIVLFLAPFGEGPLELLRRAGKVNEGLAIGEVRLLPATLLQGVLVLVIGLFAVRALKGWIGDRLMPTTRMDAGMRMSITTLFGYVGAVLVVALSMSAIGVGLERVAWVASALSVGIGFGLQAVVQNFVSGLILLAERPVKVGDWVSLAGVEGDIRRINVRATEIQMGDRSTVIVPNSEFITKIVRNVTYTDPIGMVQIKLPMPLSTDAKQAREVLMEAFVAHPGVLDSPKPSVQLDGIDGLNLMFNATGFVSSPRAASGVKSDLLFDVLDRLREAGLSLAKPPTMVLSTATATEPFAAGDEQPTPPKT